MKEAGRLVSWHAGSLPDKETGWRAGRGGERSGGADKRGGRGVGKCVRGERGKEAGGGCRGGFWWWWREVYGALVCGRNSMYSDNDVCIHCFCGGLRSIRATTLLVSSLSRARFPQGAPAFDTRSNARARTHAQACAQGRACADGLAARGARAQDARIARRARAQRVALISPRLSGRRLRRRATLFVFRRACHCCQQTEMRWLQYVSMRCLALMCQTRHAQPIRPRLNSKLH